MIRTLNIDELAALLPLSRQVNDIHVAAHPEQYHAQATNSEVLTFFAEKLDAGAQIFVADGDSGFKGFLLAIPVEREQTPFLRAARYVELDQICVDQACRGQGVGKELVSAMEAWMRDAGFSEWKTTVHSFNVHSQNLMTGQGAETTVGRYRKALPLS